MHSIQRPFFRHRVREVFVTRNRVNGDRLTERTALLSVNRAISRWIQLGNVRTDFLFILHSILGRVSSARTIRLHSRR